MVYYIDMDGVLVNVPEQYNHDFKKLNSPYWVANLQPYSYNVLLVRWLIDQGYEVYILSRAMNDANKRGKMEWLRRYLPRLPKDHIILINDTHKEDYMTKPGLLIDDTESNCKRWHENGYPAYYLYPKGSNIDLQRVLKHNPQGPG